MYYSFSFEIAEKYGLNEAVFIQNIYFWINRNSTNNKNFHNGKYWTYNTAEAFCELFPFWSVHQVRRLIKKLEEQNLLLIGNFNKKGFDRTGWYTLSDEILKIYEQNEIAVSSLQNCEMDLANSQDPFSSIATPIPDILPDTNPDTYNSDCVEKSEEVPYKKIMEIFNLVCSDNYSKIVSINGKRKDSVKARFDEFGLAGFQEAAALMAESEYMKGNNRHNWKADFDWLIKPSNFQKVLEGKYTNRALPEKPKEKDYSGGENFLDYISKGEKNYQHNS